MPNYMVCLELSSKVPANGVTISPNLGHPYCVINTKTPEMLLTITHELFHISERTYVFSSRANFKFDEALAQAVEADAYDYFYSHGEITKKREDAVENLYEYQHYALPLDVYKEKSDPEQKFPDGTFVGDSTNSCYPVGDFILYLKDKIFVNEQKVSYSDIMLKYKSIWRNGSLSEIFKTIFDLDDEKLTKAYHDFVSDKRTLFYSAALQNGEQGFSPVETLNNKKIEVSLVNNDYVTRMRRVTVEKRTDDDEKFAMVLLKDEKFDKTMKDYLFIPLSTTEDRDYQRIKNGYFFNTKEFKKDDENFEWYIIETDGGTAKTGTQSKYTLYPVYAPDQPTVKLENTTLSITFPDPKKSPSYEVADGYILTLYSGKTSLDTIEIEKDEIADDNTWSKKLDSIDKKELKNASLTISEWFYDEENMGPESKPVPLNKSSNGRWQLVNQKSHTSENNEGSTFVHKYSADNNSFYILEDWDTKAEKKYNIIEAEAVYDAPPKSVDGGETIQIKVNETILQNKNNKTDISLNGYYCVTDEVIQLYEKDEAKWDTQKQSIDIEEIDDPVGCTAAFDIYFPEDAGTTGKLILIYDYNSSCQTVYTYKWTN